MGSMRITGSSLQSCIVSAVLKTFTGRAIICVTRPAFVRAVVSGTQGVNDDVHDLCDEHAAILWCALMPANHGADVIRSSKPCKAPPRWRSLLPDSQVIPGRSDLLVLQLWKDDELLGIIGAARRASDSPFDEGDHERLESMGVVASNMIALQHKCDELQRREIVTRALHGVAGAYCVVDEDRRRMVWTSSMGYAISDDDMWAHEREIVEAVERHGHSVEADGQSYHYPSLGLGQVVRVAELGAQPIFGAERCSAIAVASAGPLGALSPREMQIARLLLAGYTTINAAAILNVSENTIRTYVRRLYRKLNVVSRADLARECASKYGLVISKDESATGASTRCASSAPRASVDG